MACTFVRPMRRVPLVLFALLVAGNLWAQRVGIVLSGGGATGMAHIGVLKALEENGIPVAPLVLGLVLGPIVQETFLTSMMKTDGNFLAFFERPLAGTFGAVTMLVWLVPIALRLRSRMVARRDVESPREA